MNRRIESPEALQALMRADFPASPQQWDAIRAPLAPGVVIAGAGSGKTTLMAARVVYLVATGQVRSDQVLGLTFTTKAAGQLRDGVRAALARAGLDGFDDGAEILEPTITTYNAYAGRLLTEHGLRIGQEPGARVITDASRYQLGARVIDRFTGAVDKLSDHPATVIQYLLALDGAMSEHLVSVDRVRSFDELALLDFTRAYDEELAGKARKTYLEAIDRARSAIWRRRELLGLVESYRRYKHDLGLIDFSDQISLAAQLAIEHPDVGAAQREAFRVVLLDEYQDTSVAQAQMLGHLFGHGHAVTAVGDPNQAIYGWRGASVSNILNFADTFPAPDGTAVPVYPLTVNRRSDRRILTVANKLIAPLNAKYEQVQPLEPAPNAADGRVQTRVFEHRDDELEWLRSAVRAAHEEAGKWSEIGVLTRDNSSAEAVFDTLTRAGVPVEIVGLSGLLRLPEVAEVVALLRLLQDVTDNPSLVTVLAGARWAIGHRDLRLLALRAVTIAGRGGRTPPEATLSEVLNDIADGVDTAELPALCDALEDPGTPAQLAELTGQSDADYSPEARERFGLLAAELRYLRAHTGEPLLDVVRRVIDVTGVDIELAASVSPAAESRRDNLDLFVKAVAEFQAVDGDVTLPALIGFLTAADEADNGMDAATPSEADSVKLLTVHRAKGLEWHTVFVVGMCETKFPNSTSRTLWTSSPSVLPDPLRGDAADLPQLRGWDKAALDDYRAQVRAHGLDEELRLGYVALTRAAAVLHVSSYVWGSRKNPFGPSPYQEVIREQMLAWGEASQWLDKPAPGTPNPAGEGDPAVPWPRLDRGTEATARLAAAELVREHMRAPRTQEEILDLTELEVVTAWDADLDRLLTEAREQQDGVISVPLPSSLSATSVSRLRTDPTEFARELARPMPRPPSPAARFGIRFHAWLESRFEQLDLFDFDDLPGRADAGIDDDADLKELIAAFEEGPFADRQPVAIEAPFSIVLAGQVVRGRIDAVFAEPDGFLVVDWKTSRAQRADPVQLALYRAAWADLAGVPLDRVRAAFYYVRTADLVLPDALPGPEELTDLVTGPPQLDGV